MSHQPHVQQHHSASQADLDVLAMITGENGTMSPVGQGRSGAAGVNGASKKRQAPRRDGPMESLMLSAVMAGAGGVSRHHFGHGAARPYASCDESRPVSPSRDSLASRAAMRSMQAPRSERLKREQAELQAQKGGESSTSPQSAHRDEASSTNAKARRDRLSPPVAGINNSRPHRRLSIDPAPVSATLQAISPPPFLRPIAVNPSTLQKPSHSAASTAATTSAIPPPSGPKVRCMARTRVPTPHGDLFLHLYHNNTDAKEHLAIVLDPIQLSPDAKDAAPRGRREIRSKSLDEVWREGETSMERVVRGAYTGRLGPGGEEQASTPSDTAVNGNEAAEKDEGKAERDILPMVRIHSECFTGETIGSMRCDCGEQLDEAIRQIASPHRLPAGDDGKQGRLVPGRGVVIYMRQEGRGIGLLEKIRAYNLQDLGHDTVAANLMLGHGADERRYDVAAEILRDLGLADTSSTSAGTQTQSAGEGAQKRTGIRLLTNNPEKVQGLAREGVYVQERVGMVPRDWKCNGQDEHPAHTPQAEGSVAPAPAMHTPAYVGPGPKDDPLARDGHRALQAQEDGGDEKEYSEWRERRAGVGLIGAGKASGGELERYLRTKVERMGHLIDLPDPSPNGSRQ